jgi:uncharacterized membrane protein YesL
MIGDVLKKTIVNFWEESVYLVLFNMLVMLALLPGIAFSFWSATQSVSWWQWLTFLWLIPWGPFVLALFYVVFDIGEIRKIYIATFFQHLKKYWRVGVIWGAVNAVVVIFLRLNYLLARQYAESTLALIPIFFMLLALLWLIWQLVVLAMYPHLKRPNFQLAMQNAMSITGHYWLVDVMLLVFVLLMLALTLRLNMLAVFVSFSFTAVFVSRLIDVVVKRELESGNANP